MLDSYLTSRIELTAGDPRRFASTSLSSNESKNETEGSKQRCGAFGISTLLVARAPCDERREMSVTLDGQNLFDEQQLEIELSSLNRDSIERAVAGLDGAEQ